jgi:hypothetical protein
MIFTAVIDYKGMVRVPMIGFGALEPGMSLWVNQVKFESLD